MAYTVDVRYFNSFWLKKVTSSNESGWDGSDWPGLPWNPHSYPMYPFKGGEYKPPEYNVEGELYTTAFNWYVEESRIRGGFNMSGVDFGARAYMVADKPNQINKSSSLIYSGIYNSRTGVNNTNSFPTGQAITRSLDPINGSIQKIHTTESDLIIFQENKISKAPMNKSIIYSSEGVAVAPQSLVIGQTEPYLGEYGISRNPESFAISGFRKYFADKDRGVILRLSRDGITEISSYGMRDYFKDYLSSISEDWVKHTLNNCEPLDITIMLKPEGLPIVISTVLANNNPCSIQIGAGLELTDGTPIIDIETGDYAYIIDVVEIGTTSFGKQYSIILSQLNTDLLQPSGFDLAQYTQVNIVKFVKDNDLWTKYKNSGKIEGGGFKFKVNFKPNLLNDPEFFGGALDNKNEPKKKWCCENCKNGKICEDKLKKDKCCKNKNVKCNKNCKKNMKENKIKGGKLSKVEFTKLASLMGGAETKKEDKQEDKKRKTQKEYEGEIFKEAEEEIIHQYKVKVKKKKK